MNTCLLLPPIIQQIHQSYSQIIPLEIIGEGGEKKAKKLPFFTWLKHLGNKEFHRQREEKITLVFAEELKKLPRMTPAEAKEHPLVQAARQYTKRIRKQPDHAETFRSFRMEFLAAKLGITSRHLEDNLSFTEFAIKYHLENYLLTHNHTIRISKNNELKLLKDGKYVKWSQVPQEILAPLTIDGEKRSRLAWKYGMHGLQNKDMYRWEKLEPILHENSANYDYNYIFEFNVCCADKPQNGGDHTWPHLKHPNGDIYGGGLYSQGKKGLVQNLRSPFRMKKGKLMSPDVSIYWPCKIFKIEVAIDEKSFYEIKASIEEDKKNPVAFNMFNHNCTMYTNNKAAIAGIHLPTASTIFEIFLPQKLRIRKIIRVIPKCIRVFLLYLQAFLINLFQVFLGATKVDPAFKAKVPDAKPHIEKFSDIFKPSKAAFHHPFILGKVIRDELLDWRKRKVQKLEGMLKELKDEAQRVDLEKRLRMVRYSLPKRWMSQSMNQ